MTPFDNLDPAQGVELEVAARAEQVRLLYGSPLVIVINLLNAPIAAAVLWPLYPPWLVGGWVALIYAVVGARMLLFRRYKVTPPEPRHAERWGKAYAVGATITGCLWGLLASIVRVTDDAAYHTFVIFVLGGMVGGAALRDSPYLPAFYGFAMPTFLPIVVALIAKGGFASTSMGLLLAIFSILLLLVGRDNNRWIASGVKANIEQLRARNASQLASDNLAREVAERRKTISALEEANERFRAIGESANDAIAMLDANGNVSYWNPAATRIFGYRSEEIIGRRYHEIVVPVDLREKAFKGYERFVATGEGEVLNKTVQLNALHKDGHEIPIELSVAPLRIAGEWHSVGIARDVSERLRIEERLREALAYSRNLIDSSPDPILVMGVDGNITDVNDALARLSGLSRDALIGRDASTLVAEPDKARAGLAEVFVKGAMTNFPITLRHASGGCSELLFNATVYNDAHGNVLGALAVGHDVTELRRIEAELRVASNYHRTLIETSLDPLVVISRAGKITDMNESMAKLTGVPRAQMIGSDYFNYFVEQERVKAGFQRVLSGEFVTNFPLSLKHTSGTVTNVIYNATLYRDATGNPVGVLAVARDITPLKQIETELRRREADLKEAQRLAQVGNWEYLPATNELTWSDEVYRIFGRDPALRAPSVEEHVKIYEPESFDRWSAAFTNLQRTGASFELDLEIVKADGSSGWIMARGQADLSAEGNVVRMFGTKQDITTRKLAEQNIARLHEQLTQNLTVLRRHEADLKSIGKLSDILQACHNRGEAYPVIAATAASLFPQSNGAVSVAQDSLRELETVVQWGENQSLAPAFTLDDCWALRTGQSYEVENPGVDIRCKHFAEAPSGPYVCLPLTVYGETTGLLHLNFPPTKVLDEETRWLVITFGDVIKLSLANLKLREALSDMALRDQLTGLFNRHYLKETMPREVKRARRVNAPLTVAMLDIDHFKELNDTYGHDAGDVVLKELGALLRNALRAGDIACRYGGEEFILVFPDCDLRSAQTRVEQICLEIKDKTYDFRRQSLGKVTVSVGLAALSDNMSSADELITAADSALYTAKQEGRDRVVAYSGKVPPSFASAHVPSRPSGGPLN